LLLISSGRSDLRSGGGIWDMGVTCRVVGFRTGVQNFVGAGLGFQGSTVTVKCNTSAYYPGQVPTPLNMSADWLGHL
jgi:hypothetical protein